MNSEEFNKRHHKNYDRNLTIDILSWIFLFLIYLVLNFLMYKIKENNQLNKIIYLLINISLGIAFITYHHYSIKHFIPKLKFKQRLLCQHCNFDFASITPNHDKSTILVDSKCPNCNNVIVTD